MTGALTFLHSRYFNELHIIVKLNHDEKTCNAQVSQLWYVYLSN